MKRKQLAQIGAEFRSAELYGQTAGVRQWARMASAPSPRWRQSSAASIETLTCWSGPHPPAPSSTSSRSASASEGFIHLVDRMRTTMPVVMVVVVEEVVVVEVVVVVLLVVLVVVVVVLLVVLVRTTMPVRPSYNRSDRQRPLILTKRVLSYNRWTDTGAISEFVFYPNVTGKTNNCAAAIFPEMLF